MHTLYLACSSGPVLMFEASKRILLRLSKARKRAYPTIARVIPQSYVIRTSVYCTVCTSTQVIDRKVMQRIAPIQRSGRGSTVGAQSAQRAPLRPLCACVLTASPGFAMAERQHTIRPTSAQPSGSPASADAAGKPATRPARPLPRALGRGRTPCPPPPRRFPASPRPSRER